MRWFSTRLLLPAGVALALAGTALAAQAGPPLPDAPRTQAAVSSEAGAPMAGPSRTMELAPQAPATIQASTPESSPASESRPVTSAVSAKPQAQPTLHAAASDLPSIEHKGLGKPKAALPLLSGANAVTAAPAGPVASLLETGSWERTLGSLVVVLGLIFIASRVFKKLSLRHGLAGAMGVGGKAPSGVLEVLARYPIARGQNLVLLRLDRRVMLCCHTRGGKLGAGGGMTLLAELTEPEEVAAVLVKTRDAASESLSRRFQSILSRSEHDADRHLSGATSNDASREPGRRLTGAIVTPRALPKGEAGRAAAYGLEAVTVREASGADAADAIRRRLAAMRSGGVTA